MGTQAIHNRTSFSNKGSKNYFTASNIMWAMLAVTGCFIIAGLCLSFSFKEEEKKAVVYEDFKKNLSITDVKQMSELKGFVISEVHQKSNCAYPCGQIGNKMLYILSCLGARTSEGNVKAEWNFSVIHLRGKEHVLADKQFTMVVKHHGKIVKKMIICLKKFDESPSDCIYVVKDGQPIRLTPQIIRDFFSDK